MNSYEEIPLSPMDTSRGTDDTEYEPNYCPHYKRLSCLLHFSCCAQDMFFPCHKCHNERLGSASDVPCELLVENESMERKREDDGEKNGHPQAKCSDADMMKCTDCMEQQEISSCCTKCSKDFAPYFCEKCKIFIKNMEIDPYHCDDCGICRANKSNHKHCYKCNLCLDAQLYEEHKCMEGSGHDVCAVCLETVFYECRFLPCSHKLHTKCTEGLIQHGSLDCPICRKTFVMETKKECGKCEAISHFFRSKGKSVMRFFNLIE